MREVERGRNERGRETETETKDRETETQEQRQRDSHILVDQFQDCCIGTPIPTLYLRSEIKWSKDQRRLPLLLPAFSHLCPLMPSVLDSLALLFQHIDWHFTGQGA